jgi:hypothetical protein
MRHRVAALLVCALFAAAGHRVLADVQTDPDTPFVRSLLQRELTAERLDVETAAYALEDVHAGALAASLRDFDERRAIADLLGEPAPTATSIGDAIEAARAATVSLDDLRARLMTQAFVFDFRVPDVRPLVPPPANGAAQTQLDAAQLSPQSKYDLAKGTQIEAGIWRAPAHGGPTGQPWPNRYFVVGHATNGTRHDATLSLVAFTVKDAALPVPAELRCDNQNVSAAQSSTVACELTWRKDRQAAATLDPDEAATVRTLAAVQSGLATIEPVRVLVHVAGRTLARGYASGTEDEDERRLRAQARQAAHVLIAGQNCRALGQCGERLTGLLKQPASLVLPFGLLAMGWTARRRLTGAPPSRGALTLARWAFGAYAVLVVVALLALRLDAAAGGMYKGLLGAVVTVLIAQPWSGVLIRTPAFAGASDSASLGLLWLFIAINLVWRGVMAFASGRRPSARRW